MELITAAQKLTTHQYYLWLLSCQMPREFWQTPEQSQFDRAAELTGSTVEKTDWSGVYGRLKSECPMVWERAIEMSKKALGINE
jgi:hypothetical protein